MKYAKAIAAGLIVYMAGQGLAAAMVAFVLLFALFGIESSGALASFFAGTSYYLAIAVTGYMLGLPDRSRALVMACAVIIPGLFVPSLIKNIAISNDVSSLTAAFEPDGPLPTQPAAIALVTQSNYPQDNLICSWECRNLLASGAARLVVIASGEVGHNFLETRYQKAMRFDESSRCKQAVRNAKLLERFNAQATSAMKAPPPMQIVSSTEPPPPDPLAGCFVQVDADIDDAEVVLLHAFGSWPAGSGSNAEMKRLCEIHINSGGSWRIIGRSGELSYALESYPYWPSPINWMGLLGETRAQSLQKFGEWTILSDFSNNLLRKAVRDNGL